MNICFGKHLIITNHGLMVRGYTYIKKGLRKPLIPFKASTQLLNEPCPGNITLSVDLILFNSEVTSIFTLFFATSLNEFITELILPEL